MSTLVMDPDDIAASYRDALYPQEQRLILAQLNLCPTSEIDALLRSFGFRVEGRAQEQCGRRSAVSNEKIRKLIAAGMDDSEIAKEVGLARPTIRARRKRMGIENINSKKKEKSKGGQHMSEVGVCAHTWRLLYPTPTHYFDDDDTAHECIAMMEICEKCGAVRRGEIREGETL